MIQTRPTGEDVTAFLDAVPDEQRRTDAHAVRELLERVTGEPAAMWGRAIVGFGSVDGWPPVSFSPRKAALTLYGVYVDADPDPRFADLGPHTTGRGCLYLKRLDAVDGAVLEELVRNAWDRA